MSQIAITRAASTGFRVPTESGFRGAVREHNERVVLRPPLVVPLAALAGFVLLLVLVATGWPPLREWDTDLSARARDLGQGRPGWVATLRVVTDAGATVSFVAAGVVLAVVLLTRRAYRLMRLTLMVVVVVPVLWAVLHLVLHRPRPLDGFVVITSNGFPSGHTSHATAAGMLAVLLLWPRLRVAGRITVVTCAVAFTALIGVSRVALLAHWPSDVLGGLLLGTAVVSLAARAPGPGSPPVPGCAGRASSGSG